MGHTYTKKIIPFIRNSTSNWTYHIFIHSMFTGYIKQRYYLYSGNSTLKEPEERQPSSYNTGGATKGQGRHCDVCFMDNDFMTDATVSAT